MEILIATCACTFMVRAARYERRSTWLWGSITLLSFIVSTILFNSWTLMSLISFGLPFTLMTLLKVLGEQSTRHSQ